MLLDKEIRGTRFYQGALYLPVVLSLAIVGFIAQLFLSTDQGLVNGVLAAFGVKPVDWLGNSSLNLWAVLVFASWRQVGYVMILYLAGLKGVDPTLREAAKVDGATEIQTFFRVVFPVMRPINIVVLVITVIESLRAFDLAFIINRGLNGLELLSVLVTNNIIGEASRVGFGSAIAVVLLVISVGPIIFYLTRTLARGVPMTAVSSEVAVAHGQEEDGDPLAPGRPPRLPVHHGPRLALPARVRRATRRCDRMPTPASSGYVSIGGTYNFDNYVKAFTEGRPPVVLPATR